MSKLNRIRLAAFTGSMTISSRRFRVLQYRNALAELGVDLNEFVSASGSWPPAEKWKRIPWLITTFLERIIPIVASRKYDVTLLQRELISTFYTLERFSGRPRIVDVDDSVWLTSPRAGRNFAALVKGCDGVICGNSYISENMKKWNSNTIIVPTAVDCERFQPLDPKPHNDRRIIGWSGLYAGSHYLLGIEGALFKVLKMRPDAILRVVSDKRPKFTQLTDDMFEFIPWSPENEVRTIQEMDIGLMPLEDSEWVKGKCSYKMLLYMACGLPVAVSPFGMNLELLEMADIGIGPITDDQWVAGLMQLLDDKQRRNALGQQGRLLVEKKFSAPAAAELIADFLRENINNFNSSGLKE